MVAMETGLMCFLLSYLATTSITIGGEPSVADWCPPCVQVICAENLATCRHGVTLDLCGCCLVCAEEFNIENTRSSSLDTMLGDVDGFETPWQDSYLSDAITSGGIVRRQTGATEGRGEDNAEGEAGKILVGPSVFVPEELQSTSVLGNSNRPGWYTEGITHTGTHADLGDTRQRVFQGDQGNTWEPDKQTGGADSYDKFDSVVQKDEIVVKYPGNRDWMKQRSENNYNVRSGADSRQKSFDNEENCVHSDRNKPRKNPYPGLETLKHLSNMYMRGPSVDIGKFDNVHVRTTRTAEDKEVNQLLGYYYTPLSRYTNLYFSRMATGTLPKEHVAGNGFDIHGTSGPMAGDTHYGGDEDFSNPADITLQEDVKRFLIPLISFSNPRPIPCKYYESEGFIGTDDECHGVGELEVFPGTNHRTSPYTSETLMRQYNQRLNPFRGKGNYERYSEPDDNRRFTAIYDEYRPPNGVVLLKSRQNAIGDIRNRLNYDRPDAEVADPFSSPNQRLHVLNEMPERNNSKQDWVGSQLAVQNVINKTSDNAHSLDAYEDFEAGLLSKVINGKNFLQNKSNESGISTTISQIMNSSRDDQSTTNKNEVFPVSLVSPKAETSEIPKLATNETTPKFGKYEESNPPIIKSQNQMETAVPKSIRPSRSPSKTWMIIKNPKESKTGLKRSSTNVKKIKRFIEHAAKHDATEQFLKQNLNSLTDVIWRNVEPANRLKQKFGPNAEVTAHNLRNMPPKNAGYEEMKLYVAGKVDEAMKQFETFVGSNRIQTKAKPNILTSGQGPYIASGNETRETNQPQEKSDFTYGDSFSSNNINIGNKLPVTHDSYPKAVNKELHIDKFKLQKMVDNVVRKSLENYQKRIITLRESKLENTSSPTYGGPSEFINNIPHLKVTKPEAPQDKFEHFIKTFASNLRPQIPQYLVTPPHNSNPSNIPNGESNVKENGHQSSISENQDIQEMVQDLMLSSMVNVKSEMDEWQRNKSHENGVLKLNAIRSGSHNNKSDLSVTGHSYADYQKSGAMPATSEDLRAPMKGSRRFEAPERLAEKVHSRPVESFDRQETMSTKLLSEIIQDSENVSSDYSENNESLNNERYESIGGTEWGLRNWFNGLGAVFESQKLEMKDKTGEEITLQQDNRLKRHENNSDSSNITNVNEYNSFVNYRDKMKRAHIRPSHPQLEQDIHEAIVYYPNKRSIGELLDSASTINDGNLNRSHASTEELYEPDTRLVYK